MQRVLSNKQMREADGYTIGELGISSGTLMQRAGEGIADVVALFARPENSVTVVCGTGNNGGDGYVCARELQRRGFDVSVYAVEGKLSADCAREKAEYKGAYAFKIKGDIIVDCLFGTGLCRAVEGEYARIIEEINNSGAFVVSADIPSGINGDNGQVCGAAVKANATVAVAEYKFGLFLNDGADYCGKIIKKDIGITCPGNKYAYIYEAEDIKKYFPPRKRNVHKGTFGTAQLIAGSDRYTGAAALCAEAALKSGCGYVKLCTSERVKTALAPKLPQIIFCDDCDLEAQAVAIGSGCGVSEELYNKIKFLLKEYRGTLVIDADGLNSLARFGADILKNKSCAVVLTPHVKEFSRLAKTDISEILLSPVERARKFAEEYGVTLLLKSAVSILTEGGRTAILNRGNSALSKAGSGDMLTGFACGTAARGVEAFEAAAVASHILGYSAEICSAERTEYCVTAKDIIKNLHLAVRNLTD